MATNSSKRAKNTPQATGQALLSMQKDETTEQFMERAKDAFVKAGLLKPEASTMTIYTYCAPDDAKEFKRLKRKTSGDWTFLVSGEWSQSPWHQGTHSFYIRSSEDKQYWALLNGSRPRRIAAVAHTPVPLSLTFVGASMLQTVYKQGGDCIGGIHDYGDIDEDLFNKIYD